MSESLAERVRTATETELGRLSGDKVLLGATAAQLERGAVVGALRRALQAAAKEATAWRSDADGDVRMALDRAVAGFESGESELAAVVDGDPPEGPVAIAYGAPTLTLARAGAACVGAPLVLDGLLLQGVSFFVNEADADLADRCRAVRSGLEETRHDAGERLLAACTSEDEETAVVAGGVAAVEASYEQYVDQVTDLGLDPKPIC